MKERRTLWLPIGPDHPILAAAGLREVTHIPVFLDGAALTESTRTHKADVSPRALLCGALLNVGEDPPGADASGFRALLRPLLEVLARGYDKTVEKLIVDLAAHLRQLHGTAVSLVVLRNGLHLFPEYQLVRSDLAVNLWVLADESPEPDRREILREYLTTFDALERSDLGAGPRAFVCYAAVAATAICRSHEEAYRRLAELREEIVRGDEGELMRNLDRFLPDPAAPWEVLRVALE